MPLSKGGYIKIARTLLVYAMDRAKNAKVATGTITETPRNVTSQPLIDSQASIAAKDLPITATPKPSEASEYAGTSQISAAGKACIPCGDDHISTAAGVLAESIRFARDGGLEHPEVVSRLVIARDELNEFERVDGSPEKVVKLPPDEKELMDQMMAASRDIRHYMTDINDLQDLEGVAAKARNYRVEFMGKVLKMQRSKKQ